MTYAINEMALRAADSMRDREKLIAQNEGTILRTASTLCRRYITKSDDEWSLALSAFSRAIDVYEISKGDFLPFSQMMIRRSLIDHYRRNRRTASEITVSPGALDGSDEPEDEVPDEVYHAVVRESMEAADNSLALEIAAANHMLADYGFRFFDLTQCSPRQERSRRDCAAAVRCVLKDASLIKHLRKTRKLPAAEIAARSGISRKSIDRYRKYLIMAILILDGDFPHLSGYLADIRKGAYL